MFEVLESIPGYTSKTATHITRGAYDEASAGFNRHLARAFELYNAYWKNSNDTLFQMSLEELLKASRFMDAIIYATGDEKVIDKVSKRATFMYDLACAMMGRPNGR